MKCSQRCARAWSSTNVHECTSHAIAERQRTPSFRDKRFRITKRQLSNLYYVRFRFICACQRRCVHRKCAEEIELQHDRDQLCGNNDESVQLLHLLAFSWFVIRPFCVIMLFSHSISKLRCAVNSYKYFYGRCVWCGALLWQTFAFIFHFALELSFVFSVVPPSLAVQSTVFYIFDRYYYYYCCYSSLWIVIPTKHSLWFCFS